MKMSFSSSLFMFILATLLVGCARDLSSNMYTSDSTLSLTLIGEVVSVRSVIIKDSDKLSDNIGGGLAGGAMGGVLGSNVGHGTGQATAVVGGAIVGSIVGATIQDKLGQSIGYEYIIKIDTSKLNSKYYEGSHAMRNAISSATTSGLVTIVQAADQLIKEGEKVYVIFSEKRTRVIPVNKN